MQSFRDLKPLFVIIAFIIKDIHYADLSSITARHKDSHDSILLRPLLLDVYDDNTKSSYKTQGLDAKEPEQQPEEEHHHWLYNLLPKVEL